MLNRAVGGINPAAVEAALQLGGKHVWMPTVDAANHARTFGSTGAYDKQASTVAKSEDAASRCSTRPASRSTACSTCSTSPPSTARSSGPATCRCARSSCWCRTARERGVQKIMITHPFFKVPALDLETLRELVDQGAYAEFGYCTVSPMWNHAPLTRVVEAISAVGRRALHPDERRRPAPQPDAGGGAARLRPVGARVGDQRGGRRADDQGATRSICSSCRRRRRERWSRPERRAALGTEAGRRCPPQPEMVA